MAYSEKGTHVVYVDDYDLRINLCILRTALALCPETKGIFCYLQ